MDPLPLSNKLFGGRLLSIAVYGAGTSDDVTRPIAASPLWKEVQGGTGFTLKPQKYTEAFDQADPVLGWRSGKDEFTTGWLFEFSTRVMPGLFEQLAFGLVNPIVTGTPQSPFVKSDNKVLAWINGQLRLNNGQDRSDFAVWCELRAMDPPKEEKKVQEVTFEAWALYSTLNTINWPA